MVRYSPNQNAPTLVNVRTYTGDGSSLNFGLTTTQTQNKIIVQLNGVVQTPSTDYFVQVTGASTNCVFVSAPSASDNITIIELAE